MAHDFTTRFCPDHGAGGYGRFAALSWWKAKCSDGAPYALSLGFVNGDLFRKVTAFSPGFIVPAEWHGTPAFFVSHGRQDPILPIDAAGRRVVVQLQRGGYRVRFREFDGGHTIPPDIRDEAITWMAS